MQQGGGVGVDFSTIRPSGLEVAETGSAASGPLSFMDVWEAMSSTIASTGQRRGAMMGCLRIDHPDIEAFIEAKRNAARLRSFNLSVLVADAFMAARAGDRERPLVFAGKTERTVHARDLTFIDSAISKTVNCPADTRFDQFGLSSQPGHGRAASCPDREMSVEVARMPEQACGRRSN
jgi:ribonucleotide reductase alpha subunit